MRTMVMMVDRCLDQVQIHGRPIEEDPALAQITISKIHGHKVEVDQVLAKNNISTIQMADGCPRKAQAHGLPTNGLPEQELSTKSSTREPGR